MSVPDGQGVTKREDDKMAYSLLDGNEAVVHGALYAGCSFFAGYPITPATSILAKMLEFLPPRGGVCLQGEDEIGSIGFCLGASMAGKKTMTATSGPGISLYSEQLSFAVGSEIPLVVVNVQRLGPSTGSATKGADGDIQFMRWGNSGGLPVIVLVPADVADCYALTVAAFNLAERYRCPVFLASNKEIGLTRESVDLNAIELEEPVDREMFSGRYGDFLPFDTESDKRSPRFLPIGGSTLVRQTSSTHGKDGYITTDPQEISTQRLRLKRKIEENVEQFTYYDYLPGKSSATLIITYGVTGRAARQAMVAESDQVSLLILKTLWPVPEPLLRKIAQPYREVLVVEMNLGQYRYEIERVLKNKKIIFLGRMDGALISPDQIVERLRNGQSSK